MREINEIDEVSELTGGDLLGVWAAQDLGGRCRAWTTDDGEAVVVAGPDLATKNRLAVCGRLAAAASLLGLVLAEVGSSYRPFGDRQLIHGLADMIELAGTKSLRVAGEFGWMDRSEPLADEVSDAHWLGPDDEDDVAELLAAGNPASYAQPGGAAVERWAGIRDDHGRLTAVAALAWSSPRVGFIAGVTVHPDVRGNGLSTKVCRLAAGEAIRERGAVALMVDEPNPAAVRTYVKLGLSYRPVAAAAVGDQPRS
ncbi:MAG TPA: GNAT family N-acetyltransferase [Microlunatus sp.]